MNLHLKRDAYRADGIFSTLRGEEGPIGVTVTHAYPDGNGGHAPKVYPGVFECVRGAHRLHGMEQDFETFEITGVEGHAGILFHWGNWNENSEGCELNGDTVAEADHAGQHHVHLVTNSRAAFARFMALQVGVDRFTLTVEG